MSKIKERIRRLAALAEDISSPNEAMIAARRLRILLDKHNLTLVECQQKGLNSDDFIEKEVTKRHGRFPRWLGSLAAAVAIAFDCQVHKSAHKSVVFQGYFADVEAAEWLLNWIQTQLSQMIRIDMRVAQKNFDHSQGRFQARAWGFGYRMVAVHTITQRLREFYGRESAKGTELVVAQKYAMIRRLFEVIPVGHNPNPVMIGEGYDEGLAAGKRVNIARGINTNEKTFLLK